MVETQEKILVTEPEDYPQTAMRILQDMGDITCGPFSREELESSIQEATILIVRLGHDINKKILEKAKNLTTIVTATTGLNHIDLDYAIEREISVLSLKGETALLETISPTADLTFGLILSLIRKIPAASADVTQAKWNRDSFKGYDLRGKTLGIYGLGRIGRKVARMGKAFDMKVIAYDIEQKNESDVNSVDENTVLKESDILSLHIPYDESLKSFFGQEKFSFMKNGSYFINTARGELVNEIALLKVLQSGHIAGAALDVLDGEYGADDEWLKSHPLIQYASKNNRLLITPHIGGASHDSMQRVEIFMAEKLKNHLVKK